MDPMRLIDLRWIRPNRAVLGWLVSRSVAAAVVAASVALLLRALALVPDVASLAIPTAFAICFVGVAVGLASKSSSDLPVRLARTHQEVPQARSPTAWAYAIALSSAASAGAASLVLFGTSVTGWAAGFALAVALASCALAGLGALTRAALDNVRTNPMPIQAAPTSDRPYFTDEPIDSASDDKLDRAQVVEALLEAIRRTSGATPAFLSLEGSWGSGKSSVAALLRKRLDAEGLLHGTMSGFHFAARERIVEALLESMARTIGKRYATADVGATLVRLWATSRPIADKLSPFGLPSDLPPRADPGSHLRSLIEAVPRPVVVIVEDVDRLRGSDVLTLVSALMTAGDLPGFVFLLVMDRAQVETELSKEISDGAGYLRKVVNAAIRVPPPPPDLLISILDGYVEAVLKARGTTIDPRDLATLSRSTWTTLVPTVRHAKHLANAFSAALSQIAGEVNTRDVLLLATLEEFAPASLAAITAEPSLWLVGRDPENLLEGLRVGIANREDRSRRQAETIDAAERDELRRGAVRQVIGLLFPDRVDELQLLRDQRVAHFEYFRRYVERRVAPGRVPDLLVQNFIEVVNRAGIERAGEAVAKMLRDGPTYALLDRFVVLAELFAAEVRAPVIDAVARGSISLAPSDNSFIPSERERARALIFRLLELGKESTTWQKEAIDGAIRSSSSLEFARELVGLTRPEHNAILTDYQAFQAGQLEQLLAEEIQRRLKEGLDPFETEGRYAPYILAALKDRTLASRYAVGLGQVESVLSGYAYPAGLPGRTSRIRWDTICGDFDVEELKRGADAGGSLSAELLAANDPCPKDLPEGESSDVDAT